MNSKEGSPSKRSVARIVQFVRDTSNFESKVHGYELDQEFEANGNQVIYSIDTDILDFFWSPIEEGSNRIDRESGKRLREGYSQIFQDDPEEVAGAIGDALVESIFFRNVGRVDPQPQARHLLVPPGVDREIVKGIDKILRDALDRSNSAREEVENEEKHEILENLRGLSGEELFQAVSEQLPGIFNAFLASSGPAAIGRRMRRLTRNASMTSISKLSEVHSRRFPVAFIEMVKEAIPSPEFGERRNELSELLRKHIADPEKTTPAQENDLLALSTIFALNERIVRHGFKICHLTGSYRLHAGLKHLYVSLQDHNLGEVFESTPSLPYDGAERADRYCLRYPLAFWKSSSFRNNIRPKMLDESDLALLWDWTRWVDPIVPREIARSDPSGDALSEYVRRARYLGLTEAAADNLEAQWKRFSTLIVPARAKVLERFSGEFEEVAKNLDRAFAETFNNLLDSCAPLGLLFGGGRGPRSRLNPPIIFEANTMAQDAIDAIEGVLANRSNAGASAEFEAAFNKLAGGETPTDRYFFNIGVAILFSNESQYESAKIYASRAAAFAQNLSPGLVKSAEITGREAYYLLSILTRITARSIRDFESSRIFLRLARNRLKEDSSRNPNLGISTFRFDSEEVAWELGEALFQRFKMGRRSIDVDFAKGMLRRVNLLHSSECGANERASRDKIDFRLSINALSASNYCQELIGDPEREIEHLRTLAHEFDSIIEYYPDLLDDDSQGSYLHKATAIGFLAFWGPTLGRPPLERANVEAFFSPENISQHSATSYDNARYNWLRDAVLNKLQTPTVRGKDSDI